MKFRPSIIASSLSGIILLIVIVLFFYNLEQLKQNPYQIMVILSLLGIGIGIHAENHYEEEVHYDWNPLQGKWTGNDTPSCQNF